MWISSNNLNIFIWNNTYSHLYEITCKHMYEIGKTQRFKFFLKGHKDCKRHWKNKEIYFSFHILWSIRTFWNITTCKMFIFLISNLESTSNKFAIWNCLFVWPTTIAIPPKPTLMKSLSLELSKEFKILLVCL